MDFKIQDMDVKVVLKNIKNIHLSVYPPNGYVTVSAPETMTIETIRSYVVTKLKWIYKQRNKLLSQCRETPREFINRESHYYNGQRYLLKVIENNKPPCVTLSHSEIILSVRTGSSELKKMGVLDNWYRQQLSKSASTLIAQWEKKLSVTLSHFIIRKMKTKWGSCSPRKRSIRLNLELAKKPVECLEYIVVHEMIHLIEPQHNKRFVMLMNKFVPKWRYCRDLLNSLPLSHQNWKHCECDNLDFSP